MFLGELVSQILMALAMFAAGALLVPLARRLNEYENHKTDTEFENHLISKVFVLQFATAYGPLFYIAPVRAGGWIMCKRRPDGLDLETGRLFKRNMICGVGLLGLLE